MTSSPSANADSPLGSLYKEQSRELWALFYAYCGHAERAQDAVQEAFLRLQQHTGDTIRDPRAWLLLVGKNWLRDQSPSQSQLGHQIRRLGYQSGNRDEADRWNPQQRTTNAGP